MKNRIAETDCDDCWETPGRCYNNNDPNSGQWVPCQTCCEHEPEQNFSDAPEEREFFVCRNCGKHLEKGRDL